MFSSLEDSRRDPPVSKDSPNCRRSVKVEGRNGGLCPEVGEHSLIIIKVERWLFYLCSKSPVQLYIWLLWHTTIYTDSRHRFWHPICPRPCYSDNNILFGYAVLSFGTRKRNFLLTFIISVTDVCIPFILYLFLLLLWTRFIFDLDFSHWSNNLGSNYEFFGVIKVDSF